MSASSLLSFGVDMDARFKRRIGLLALVAPLLLPLAAGAAPPYSAELRADAPYQPLPIEGGGPVITPPMITRTNSDREGVGKNASAGIALSFPVRFFGERYDEVAAGARGILTFGKRADTLCNATLPATKPACSESGSVSHVGPIPRSDYYPNRLVALWWEAETVCSVRYQEFNDGAPRQVVIDYDCENWVNFPFSKSIQMQIWITEGTSNLQVRYGPNRLAALPGRSYAYAGLMSPPAGGGPADGKVGLPCAAPHSACSWDDYPAGKAIDYTVPADLAVTEVATDAHSQPGLEISIEATIRNMGDSDAPATTARFFLSPRPSLGADAVEIGEQDVEALDIGSSTRVTHEATLPNDLLAGGYYIFTWVDPEGLVPDEADLANNLRASPAFTVGVRAPILSVEEVIAPRRLVPGGPFNLEWKVRNLGTAPAQGIPYVVVLSTGERPTLTNRVVHHGVVTVDASEAASGVVPVELPADVPTGVYRIGLILDPTNVLPELSKRERTGVSEPSLISESILRILTDELPFAQAGEPFCLRLEAAGGVGDYVWAVSQGSELPAGLDFDYVPKGAREAGEPYISRLCGRPSLPGTHAFELEVHSGVQTATAELVLEVRRQSAPLEISSVELPVASYLEPFDVRLIARGGEPPYEWSLVEGRLPEGLEFRSDGGLIGRAAEDGRFPLLVRVTDVAGVSVHQDLILLVNSPNRLRCGSRSLPSHELGQPYDLRLSAAGGTRPYRWQSVETRRLAEEVGESSRSLGQGPPPGLELGSLGEVGGAPTESGRFLWTVSVSDAGRIPAEDSCLLVVDVHPDQGLIVSSLGLVPALAGHAYEAQLTASGGSGGFHWSVLGGIGLPVGMSLSSSGKLSGTPTLAQLDGDPERTFPFLVEVRDENNRRGLAALSLVVLAAAGEPIEASTTKREIGGCSVAGSGGNLAWIGMLALGLALVARRREGGDERLLLVGLAAAGAVWAASCGSGDGSGGDGAGGEEAQSCQGRTCADGTSCNAEKGRCECTSEPDSCAPFGRICSSTLVCIEKEEDETGTEGGRCESEGAVTPEGLVCTIPPGEETGSWARSCTDSSECPDNRAICRSDLHGGALSVCWENTCGPDAVGASEGGDPVFLNGEAWGPCDDVSGTLQPNAEGRGTCLPELRGTTTRFLCVASGSIERGGSCRPVPSSRTSATSCEQGLDCVAPSLARTRCYGHDNLCDSAQFCQGELHQFCEQKECLSDGECGEGNYCLNRRCEKLGVCEQVCNGGTKGAMEPFGACDVHEGVPMHCNGGISPSTAGLPEVAGYCRPACDLFDPTSCGEGDDFRCMPAPTAEDPLGGTCLPTGGLPPPEPNEPCTDRTCAPGEVCRTYDIAEDYPFAVCLALCECEGEGGWDDTGGCRTTSSQCDEGTTCTTIYRGNDKLGACLPD